MSTVEQALGRHPLQPSQRGTPPRRRSASGRSSQGQWPARSTTRCSALPERLGVGRAELGADVGVAVGGQHQRGAVDAAQVLARAREHLRRRRAVELEDRALGAVVEVLPDLVDSSAAARACSPPWNCLRPTSCSAPSNISPANGVRQIRAHPVPLVAGQQRHAGDHHQPLERARAAAARWPGRPRPSRARPARSGRGPTWSRNASIQRS